MVARICSLPVMTGLLVPALCVLYVKVETTRKDKTAWTVGGSGRTQLFEADLLLTECPHGSTSPRVAATGVADGLEWTRMVNRSPTAMCRTPGRLF